MDFSTIYRPLTSRPFLSDDSYREMVPCRALRPYIACYWISKGFGADAGKKGGEILVIPDTCMDLIIKVDHGSQTVTGYLSALFDRPFTVKEKEADGAVTTFAIRFYFWAAHLFLDLDFKEAHNHTLDLRDLGADWVELFWQAFDRGDLERQTERIEAFLLKRLFWVEQNSNLFNSIHRIVHTAGNSSVKEICDYCCVSQRQMERIFSKEIGLPGPQNEGKQNYGIKGNPHQRKRELIPGNGPHRHSDFCTHYNGLQNDKDQDGGENNP